MTLSAIDVSIVSPLCCLIDNILNLFYSFEKRNFCLNRPDLDDKINGRVTNSCGEKKMKTEVHTEHPLMTKNDLGEYLGLIDEELSITTEKGR
jgi:hypothetical protein